MIRFACPGCQSVFTVGDEKGRQDGKVPEMRSSFHDPRSGRDARGPAERSAAYSAFATQSRSKRSS